jgi:TRAP-type C4-dicarboxylate transport system substrate-binding protein
MELSPQEKQRMDRLSQDDQLKLKAIMQMMAKERDAAEKDAKKAKGMMEDDGPKIVNSLYTLITNHLKQTYPDVYDEATYRSFYNELMDNADAGRVELDGLDVVDEFDNFISVNTDNVD